MSTTTLSQRLRDLRTGLFPDIETVNEVLDECIAQAEAMEKLAFFEARVKPSSDDPEAQAGERWRIALAHPKDPAPTVDQITLEGEQSDPCGTITVKVRMSDGREVEAIRTNANSIYHMVTVADPAFGK